MPSIEHEAVVQLILANPRMLEVLLATGGVVVPPDKNPEIADSNLSVREPDEFHAELVTVHTVMGRKLAVVVEVQTDPPKPAKRRDWPAYLTVAGRRHACDAVLRTLKHTDAENFASSTRLIRYLAPPAARNALGELMKITLPRDDFIDGLIDEGMAHALLRFVTARGFEIPDDIRDTVLSCTDTSQLEAWCDRAATAPSIDEIFKR